MSKYPVESSDIEGITAGVNYLLSGPAGLGQNFSGKSNPTGQVLSGNYFILGNNSYTVFSQEGIEIASVEKIDNYTFKFNFTTTQFTPPFSIGNRVQISNQFLVFEYIASPIGAVECTEDYVILKWLNEVDFLWINDVGYPFYVFLSFITTNDVSFFGIEDLTVPVYADAFATINNETDRVFLSGQVDGISMPFANSGTLDKNVTVNVQLNRYLVSSIQDGINTLETYSYETTVVQKSYNFDVPAGSTEFTKNIDGVYFTSFIDQPPLGYYIYRIEFYIVAPWEDENLTTLYIIKVDATSLTSQVVKQ